MRIRILTVTWLLLSVLIDQRACEAQNTVGVLQYDQLNTFEGYNFFYPPGQGNVYLIDNCGQVVHVWPDSIYQSGHGAFLMDNGDIVRTASTGGGANPIINAGGGGQKLQRKDWSNNILWEYEYNSPTYRLHHDFSVMPNGNILATAWELKELNEAIANGLDTTAFNDSSIWPDHIIELEPVGSSFANIVWEWHAWDHLIQDYDSTKANYGVVADHPELIDLNNEGNDIADWLHINALDYNPDLDQILLSVPTFNEIWIIDHSTTTAEAASHSGGNSGMGGDLIYRWGNPAAYDRGDSTDHVFNFQHDAHWIDVDMDPNHPDAGKIMVFNNRLNNDHSRVDIIEPPIDVNGNYFLAAGQPYGPATPSWSWQAPNPTDFFSSGLSGAQKLRNGNVLICSGRQGHIFEVTDAGNVVWDYEYPIFQGVPLSQGSPAPTAGNTLWRAYRYGMDFPAFQNANLTPFGYLEADPDTLFCQIITSIAPQVNSTALGIFPVPAQQFIHVHATGIRGQLVFIHDALGRLVHRSIAPADEFEIQLDQLGPGIHHFSTASGFRKRFVKE